MHAETDFPRLRGTARLGGKNTKDDRPIFDVKFYPYDDPAADPVFAMVTGRDVYVCRPNGEGDNAFSILNHFRDPNENASINSIVWSQDLESGAPLLCIAGSGFKSIKIFNAVTAQLVKVINGHGGDVNDLAISPRSPDILASCAGDYEIRLWSLDTRYHKQPCAAILSGEGHTQPILTLDFHPSGRYLISGGQDTMICLWSVPDIPNDKTGNDKPEDVHYPLFVSSEVHSDYVDCIKFFGDLILSRACGSNSNEKTSRSNDQFKQNDILLWKIEGFPSEAELTPPLPRHGIQTRSAFGGKFQRLLTFQLDKASPFYMRFSLFNAPGHRPILAMGNELSKYSFWDLRRLQEGYDPNDESLVERKPGRKKKRGAGDGGARSGLFSARERLGREGSAATNSTGVSNPSSSTAPPELKFDIADPFKPIAAHKSITVPGPLNFACRQVAWSNCGRWCVAVGDYQMLVLFKR